MNVHFKDKVLFRSSDNDVMDISHWSLEEGNDLNMLHGPDDDETFRHHDMRGRSFVVNEDGTMSPAPAPWLCLGIGLPRMCLVEKSSPKALHFANRPEGVFQLALAGAYKGFGITNMYEGTKRHGEWSYTEIVIGSADDALSAHFDENFLRRESDGLSLDVAFWKYKEGNHVNWVGGETEERTRLHGGGRDFIPDPRAAHGLPYMLICGGSPNFVLGCNIDPRIYSQVCVTKQEEGAEPETAATEADN